MYELNEFIRRGDVIKTILEKPDMTEDEKAGIILRLNKVPAEDVHPILFCKDCKHKGWAQEPSQWRNCNMTVREYNEWCKKLNNARSFVYCIDHALQKSDDNAKMQFSVIGWSAEMKDFLETAIECYAQKQRKDLRESAGR